MKKRIEAELISIAHRILKLKNKSEVDQLYKETQKLYEAITILKFYGDNYEMVKESISKEEIEEKVSAFIDSNETEVTAKVETEKQSEVIEEKIIVEETTETEEEPIIVGEIIIEDEIEEEVEDESFEDNDTEEETEVEDLIGDEIDEVAFMPSFELSFEEEKAAIDENASASEEKESKNKIPKQITMDDVMGDHFKEPVFVKPHEINKEELVTIISSKEAEKISSLNDSLSNSISIGLNDKIGFVKHLFNNSNEDYNRVLSQLNTFDTFDDAKTFLNEMVIPDYNYWVGKEEYLERFMEIIENKFK